MNFQNFEKADRRILNTATLLLLLAVLLLWQDDWIYQVVQGGRGDLEYIGDVKELNRDVRRRHEIALSWLPLKNKNEIFQGDSIFTGNDSTVVIKTKTGEEISIAPNSLVVINARKDSISLDIGFGSVEGKVEKGKKLLITSNNNLTELEGDQAQIRVDAGDGNKLVLNVLAGQVNVQSKDGTKIIRQSELTEFTNDGRIVDPTKNAIEILSPIAGQRIQFKSEAPVAFSWASGRNLSRTKIKIARDATLKDTLVNTQVSGSSYVAYDLPLDVPLFWQVIAEGAQSDVGTFTMVGNRPPVPLSPKPGFQLYYDPGIQTPTSLTMDLTWAEGSPSGQFELQVARDFEFKKVLLEQKTRTTKFILNNLAIGEFFWRVRSVEFPNQAWSEISYFRVGPEPSKVLTPPLPRFASSEFLIETKLHGRPAAEIHSLTKIGAQKHIAKFPTLRWSKAMGADRYELQIARNRTFTDVILSQTIEANSYTWKNIEMGKYFWRVRGLAESAKQGSFTPSQQINIGLAPPQATSQTQIIDEVPDPVLLSAPPPPLKIAWNPTVFTGFYEVHFSKEANFTNYKQFITNLSEKTFQIDAPGVFYWRVRSLDAYRSPVTLFSSTNSLEFQRIYKDPTLNRNLAGVYPKQQDSIILVGTDKSELEFRWSNPYPGMNYRIELSHDPDFNEVFHTAATKEHHYKYDEPFTKRIVYWRIRAESEKFTSDWTAANRFLVSYENTPFDFESSETAFAARQLAQQRQKEVLAAQLRRIEKLRSPASTVDLQLDTPQLIEPLQVYELESNIPAGMTASYLANQPYDKFYGQTKSYPIFKWEKVPAAERYVFEIARDPDFKTSVVKAPAWDPYFEWDTARPGQFYYRVQAFNDRYNRSAFSPTRPLLVTVNTPVTLSSDFYVEVFDEPKDMWQPPSPFLLSWTSTIFARGYEIEFSEDKSFALTKVFKTEDINQELRVSKPGMYYWRVRAINEFNVAISKFSDIRSIEVIQTHRGPASVNTLTGLFPVDRTMLFVGQGMMNLIFHWTTPELANKRKLAANETFKLEVSDSRDFKRVLTSIQSRTPDLIVKKDLPEGELYWRVRYADQLSPVYQFTLRRERLPFEGASFAEATRQGVK